MADTIDRSSPKTGTILPQGRPYWIVDGKAYDFTEWLKIHPGGSNWFGPSMGRDISAVLHTYHREPAKLQKFLARYEIEGFSEQDILPKLGVPPFLLNPDFDATKDLPRLDYRDQGSLLAVIRKEVNERFSKRDLKRYDRSFDLVTWLIVGLHLASLVLLVVSVIPAWAFVVLQVARHGVLAFFARRNVDQPRLRDGRRGVARELRDVRFPGRNRDLNNDQDISAAILTRSAGQAAAARFERFNQIRL